MARTHVGASGRRMATGMGSLRCDDGGLESVQWPEGEAGGGYVSTFPVRGSCPLVYVVIDHSFSPRHFLGDRKAGIAMTVAHLKIVLDMDGVIADFCGAIIEAFGHPPKDSAGWDWNDWYPGDMELQERARAFTKNPESYRNLQPLPGARKSIRKIAQAGHPLYIVSARPKGAQEITEAWVHKYLRGDIKEVHTVGTSQKVHFIEEMHPHLVVDDRPEIIKSLQELGIPVVIFDQPWNVDKVDGPRAYGWTHLRKVVLGK